MKESTIDAIENFVAMFEKTLKEFEDTTYYLRSDLKGDERKAMLKILRKKLKEIKKAETKKELKKHLDIDVITGKIGDDE